MLIAHPQTYGNANKTLSTMKDMALTFHFLNSTKVVRLIIVIVNLRDKGHPLICVTGNSNTLINIL